MKPEKGKYGLWYVAGAPFGFPTEDAALQYLKEQADLETRLAEEDQSRKAKARASRTAGTGSFLGYHWSIWVFSLVLVLPFYYGLDWIFSPASPEVQAQRAEQRGERDCKSTTGHKVAANRLIKNHMKSPSTAEVSSQKVDYLGDCRASHMGYVDAQNSFGAMIRNTYRAVTVYDQAAQRYRLESLDMH